MSKKKKKNAAKKNLPPVVESTAAAKKEFDDVDEPKLESSNTTEAYVQSDINGWIVYTAVSMSDGIPINILDLRMPSFPNIRIGDLSENEKAMILQNIDPNRIITMKNPTEFVHRIFDEKLNVWKQLYGSIENALRMRNVPNTFRKVS